MFVSRSQSKQTLGSLEILPAVTGDLQECVVVSPLKLHVHVFDRLVFSDFLDWPVEFIAKFFNSNPKFSRNSFSFQRFNYSVVVFRAWQYSAETLL